MNGDKKNGKKFLQDVICNLPIVIDTDIENEMYYEIDN